MISIKGVIGLDVDGKQFASMISRLSGDLEVEIDSPGGSVIHGISIFNAFKRYDKGKVHIQVVGECSSIAAYIMLAGDTLKFEPNCVVVLHNPWSAGIGDYRSMLKQAEILEKMTAQYANAFVEKGIFDYETMRAYMDEEKWFIGAQDLELLGEVIKRDIPKLKTIEKQAKVKAAKDNIKNWQAKFKNEIFAQSSFDDLMSEDLKIAAYNNPTAQLQKPKEREKTMDLKELKQNYPELYAQAKSEGAKLGESMGKEEEQKRVNALLEFLDDDKNFVTQAIKEGKSIYDPEVFAKLTRARINKTTITQMQKENPQDLNPKEPPHVPENLLNSTGKETPEQKAQKFEEESQKLLDEILKEI